MQMMLPGVVAQAEIALALCVALCRPRIRLVPLPEHRSAAHLRTNPTDTGDFVSFSFFWLQAGNGNVAQQPHQKAAAGLFGPETASGGSGKLKFFMRGASEY